jgi:FlaA1/EpsC-like NDP-sugar epimerase
MVFDRIILVTGAGGCVGSELCRQIMSYQPRLVVLVDQSEGQLFEIEREILDAGLGRSAVAILADVRDLPRMHDVFEKYQPSIVFHCAALKHVPMMERNPGEAIECNILGSVVVATLAFEFLVDRFMLVSTDQAIQPVNVTGAVHRLGEIFVQALSTAAANRTKMMTVRFGNVVESPGGVIARFKRQIDSGGPVTVTDPQMRRKFIGVSEAAELTLQCAALGRGEEIFGLSSGLLVNMLDLATWMISLSGLTVGADIQIQLAGLRPGENPNDPVWFASGEAIQTSHPRIARFLSPPASLQKVQRDLYSLFGELQESDADGLRSKLRELVAEYCPTLPTTREDAGSSASPTVRPAPRTRHSESA